MSGAPETVYYKAESDNYYCSNCHAGLGHKVYRALRAVDAPGAPDCRPFPTAAAEALAQFEKDRFGRFRDDGSFEERLGDTIEDEDLYDCRWVGGKHDAQVARAAIVAVSAYGQPAWQPIETAPKDGKPFLAIQMTPGDFEGQCTILWSSRHCWSTGLWIADSGLMPTHWMPLPTPPSPDPHQ